MKIQKLMQTNSIFFNKKWPGCLKEVNLGNHWLRRFQAINVILPRIFCVYDAVDCFGVPLFKLGAFAKIQAGLISPFSEFGIFTLKQDNVLHIWIWNKKIEEDIARDIYSILGKGVRFRIFPSSLAAEKQEDGVFWLELDDGLGAEAQLWRNKKLISTVWFQDKPDGIQWERYLSENYNLLKKGWPSEIGKYDNLKILSIKDKVWGWNITPSDYQKIEFYWSSIVNNVLLAATLIIASYGAYIFGKTKEIQFFIDEKINLRTSEIEGLAPLIEMRNRVQERNDWLSRIKELSPSPSVTGILHDLSNTWAYQDIYLRELDISPPNVQAILVLKKSDIKITDILEHIESKPQYYDARFVDVVGGDGFKMTWRIKYNKNGVNTYDQ